MGVHVATNSKGVSIDSSNVQERYKSQFDAAGVHSSGWQGH